jgi:hypothetical protein
LLKIDFLTQAPGKINQAAGWIALIFTNTKNYGRKSYKNVSLCSRPLTPGGMDRRCRGVSDRNKLAQLLLSLMK